MNRGYIQTDRLTDRYTNVVVKTQTDTEGDMCGDRYTDIRTGVHTWMRRQMTDTVCCKHQDSHRLPEHGQPYRQIDKREYRHT